MTRKFISHGNVLASLGVVMIGCLPPTMVTFLVSLIWNGQPIGNTAGTIADAFATVFAVAFFGAFALAIAEQQSRSS